MCVGVREPIKEIRSAHLKTDTENRPINATYKRDVHTKKNYCGHFHNVCVCICVLMPGATRADNRRCMCVYMYTHVYLYTYNRRHFPCLRTP